jgi:hypothetical protein
MIKHKRQKFMVISCDDNVGDVEAEKKFKEVLKKAKK